jgi:hypothetical protein
LKRGVRTAALPRAPEEEEEEEEKELSRITDGWLTRG